MAETQHFRPTVLVRPHWISRADNCDPSLWIEGRDRCPNCGLFHLRPGYCAALDLVMPQFKGDREIQRAARAKLKKELDDKYGPEPVTRLATKVETKLAVETQLAATSVSNETKLCAQCGQSFEPSRFAPKALYCTPACRLKAYRSGLSHEYRVDE